MSEVKVNKITPTTNCGTVTLGDSGDTIAIPAGVNLTSGGALTNSGTITNTGSITGVAITGTIDNQVNWQTTVKTTGFTAVAGEGYFCNTTSAAFTVTLPASPSAGDLVGIKDYANTADTNNITIGRNGSNIEGVANDFVINIEGGSITLIYVDATKGWLSTAAAKASDISEILFVTATGGTITTCGDYKIHTFTGPGTFTVSCAGNPVGSNTVDYLVVAGGGGGSRGTGSGGSGAGGFRTSSGTASGCYSTSPLGACVSALPVTATGYPITVGGGGAVAGSAATVASDGANSVFSSITSTGGGAGATQLVTTGNSGGSGGGGSSTGGSTGGAGNTPSVSPPQGNNGGAGGGTYHAGGGGGATAAGSNYSGTNAGNGGAGAASSITGSSATYAGGGGGSSNGGTNGTGGTGGGGNGGIDGGINATAGTANTGGGAGGVEYTDASGVANGGSGIVVIRYKFQ
jgi:hypothetical protein